MSSINKYEVHIAGAKDDQQYHGPCYKSYFQNWNINTYELLKLTFFLKIKYFIEFYYPGSYRVAHLKKK